jgi:hypothetical protein
MIHLIADDISRIGQSQRTRLPTRPTATPSDKPPDPHPEHHPRSHTSLHTITKIDTPPQEKNHAPTQIAQSSHPPHQQSSSSGTQDVSRNAMQPPCVFPIQNTEVAEDATIIPVSHTSPHKTRNTTSAPCWLREHTNVQGRSHLWPGTSSDLPALSDRPFRDAPVDTSRTTGWHISLLHLECRKARQFMADTHKRGKKTALLRHATK